MKLKLRDVLILSVLLVLVVLFVLSYLGIFKAGFIDVRTHVSFLPLVVVLSALLDSINPCAFSVLFLTIAFLFSLGHERSKIMRAGFTYILGIFLVYFLIGVGILKALSFFNITNGPAKVGAVFVIAFSVINIVNEFFPKFPIKLKIPKASHDRISKLISQATIPAALLLGLFVGIFEFPCTGGPYIFILGMLQEKETYLRGVGYLLLYNLIFVLPLVVALMAAADKVVLDRIDKWRRLETRAVKVWFAVVFIALGLLVFLL